jgi:hypothetical protein
VQIAAIIENAPKTVVPAYLASRQRVSKKPGWTIQVRKDISARVIPLDPSDRRLNVWPRKLTNVAIDAISTLFATKAQTVEAVDGEKEPPGRIELP